MDRVISLLAALVGLIALGGAILVHTNGDTQRNQMAAEIAQLKLSVGLITQQQQRPAPGSQPAISSTEIVPPAAEPSTSAVVIEPAPSSEVPDVALSSSVEPLSQLQPTSALSAGSSQEPIPPVTTDMTALLARIAQLEKTTQDQASQLEEARSKLSALPSGEPPAQVSTLSPSSAAPGAVAADGPTTDCIPLGTRFMGTTGDKFPICNTKLVVKVAAVTDGLATIAGPGDIAPGAFGALDKGCSVMVFSADTSGYAEMRVTCQ